MIKHEKQTGITVVGIGASAGGLEPLQQITAQLPESLPTIAIVIAQHLSPDYKSMLVDLTARKTSLPVRQVEQGMSIEGNTIYIAPATSDVIVKNGAFELLRPSDMGAHPSIDILFQALAREYKARAVGIVLSGTGKDGSRGIIDIKKEDGIIIVQDPETARYEGMPQSAIQTGMADHVLPPEKIGSEFQHIITKKEVSAEVVGKEARAELAEQDATLRSILDLLEKRMGIDFSDYKMSSITRRLRKRIADGKFNSEQEYLDFIRQHPEELDTLFDSLLIGVTSFFRDPGAFKEVDRVIEKIVREKKDGEVIRVWVPGCATGEEAYSLAIIICEALHKQKKSLPVQIFATDIDIKALQKARTGIFATQAVQTLSQEMKNKYFTKLNEKSYEIIKDLHKMVLFSHHDVTSNPPFLRLDLISCRNLLIYFNLPLQKKVMPLFYYALNPEGYLFLGKSEDIGRFQQLFDTIDTHHKIFRKRLADGKKIRFPNLRAAHTKHYQSLSSGNRSREDLTIAEMVKETLYNGFTDPYVVVDSNMEIVEISGDVSLYLQFKAGSGTLNVVKLIHSELQLELRAAMAKATTQRKVVQSNIRKFLLHKKPYFVRLSVRPLLYTRPDNPYYIIIFEEIPYDKKFVSVGKEVVEQKDSPRILELEQELDATKEYMNTLLQELETSNEELQASNEELQSSNEELQASNEELESANEELQATNEELENAYSQLRESSRQIEQQKGELERSEENLKALLNNTHVGFILVDKNYTVKLFNKVARDTYVMLFKNRLKEGLSLFKILPEEVFPQFLKHFKRALEGQQVIVEEEMWTEDNEKCYFQFNYTPVGQKYNKEIENVSLSFLDITERKNAERELEKAAAIINSSDDAIIGCDLEGKITSWNKGAEELYGYKREYVPGRHISMLLAEGHKDDFAYLVAELQAGRKVRHFETKRLTQDGRTLDVSITASPICDEAGRMIGISKIGRDITERKKIREALRLSQLQTQATLDALPSHIAVLDKTGTIITVNRAWMAFGEQNGHQGNDIGINYLAVLRESDGEYADEAPKVLEGIERVLSREADFFSLEYPCHSPSEQRWFLLQVAPLEEGVQNGVVVAHTNITERVLLEKQKDEFISIASHELKTPVTSLKAYTQVMQVIYQRNGDRQATTFLSKIDGQLNRLTDLINDLLDVSKIEAGKLQLKKETFAFDALVDEIVESMQLITSKHTIQHLGKTEKEVTSDRERIGQVLTNLMANAIKYSPRADKVIVTTDVRDNEVSVSVQDFGIGIPADKQKHIFNRFFRAHNVDSSAYPGLGLGLYISAEIVTRLGGHIGFSSKEGEGSTFYFSLPLNVEKTVHYSGSAQSEQ
jgi:two-component system CheB/CheR fusion protein